ncbi:tripartite tricarboxylate transporter substrate binding protein [Thalassovita sp.]|uniref:Bug family tripartite tricarboxylate transporter substrate binding protein n=1 Tax=Thalassovita sp. TaxID=1979401 RepID=UPI0029DE5A8B|nr:tripartite tricarboxylate transporter substrate binding protein [Thalassovita sp.]
MTPTFTRILRAGLAAALIAPVAQGATAQDYPSKPVTIIHAYPGFALDAVTRAAAEKLQEKWGQPVVVDTRPGANEVIAANTVAQSKPDGHTILIGSESTFLNNPSLYKTLPYDPATGLDPVSQLFKIQFGLLVRGDLEAQTANEFIAMMKANGPKQTFGSFGVGHMMHLGMEKFLHAADLQMKHIPYSNGGQMLQDMLGGQLDATVASAVLATRFGEGGKLRMLAMNGAERQPSLPDVPTFAEIGFPDLEIYAIVGIAVPGGTPAKIKTQIYEAFKEVISDPAFVEKVTVPNGYDLVLSTPDEFAAFIAAESPKTAALIDSLGVSLSQ